jgi:hypothetical protein
MEGRFVEGLSWVAGLNWSGKKKNSEGFIERGNR